MKIAMLIPDNRDEFRRWNDPEPYFGPAPTALLEGFAKIPSCEVHIISCVKQPVRSPEKIAKNIFYHSVLVSRWGWMRTGYWGCIRAIRRKLHEIQPDVVHGQGTERYCALSAERSGFPNVITIHGHMRRYVQVHRVRAFSFHWLAAKLETLSIRRSCGVVCITRYTQQTVHEMARRTWVVPNAVDPTFFEVERKPDSTPLVLCVANVTLHKNQNAFIRALDPLAARRDFKLVFLGNATKGRRYDEEFFSLVQSREWCSHEGFADREQLKNWLGRATMLALPSLEDNCPMAVLEAMAGGVPVLAARIGGLPDLVEEGVSGSFCDPNNFESMRVGVGKILADLQTANQMARVAKQRAKEHFEPSIIARRHLEIYSEVKMPSNI